MASSLPAPYVTSYPQGGRQPVRVLFAFSIWLPTMLLLPVGPDVSIVSWVYAMAAWEWVDRG